MQKYLTNIVLVVMMVWLTFLTIFVWLIPKTLKIGVVDMQVLVAASANQLAARYSDGQVPKSQLQKSIEHIKSTLEDFAVQNLVVLLNKSAVLNDGVEDYTNNIQERLAWDGKTDE